eukprot:SAG31_NODE_3485_length_4211_cov_2.074903_4_plen_82_part_00
MSPFSTLTNCIANGVYIGNGSQPYAAFRMAPHVMIDGVGPCLNNCQVVHYGRNDFMMEHLAVLVLWLSGSNVLVVHYLAGK